MLEIKDNIWNYLGKYPIGIPTNGFIKNNGEAVMGRGLAKECLNKFPNASKILAKNIKKYGNFPSIIVHEYNIFSFPVKPIKLTIKTEKDKNKILSRFKPELGKSYPGWMCKADLNLIKKSSELLSILMDTQKWDKVVLPKVGCGNGELDWNNVKPILEKYLDNKLIIVDIN